MKTLPNKLQPPESAIADSGVINVFITNLNQYNNGNLIGEWLALPTTPEYVNQCLERIGIDNINDEEYFLTDYESSINGLSDHISECSNLNELNYLASRLEELGHDETEMYEAVIDMGGHIQSVTDLINLVDNLDCFQCLWNVNNEYDLGYYWIEESGCYNLKDLGNLANYFDYEKYGHDIVLEQGGTFYSCGYVYHTGESFTADYDGESVPEEYCVLSEL